jgi:hypothetical protein
MTTLKQMIARQINRAGQRFFPQERAVPGDATAPLGWPPGHFYSPIPSLTEVGARASRIFDRQLRDLPGIDLNAAGQVALLRQLRGYFDQMPFDAQPRPGLRFHYANPNFGPGEALILASWLRHFRPRRIIEIGSGYSSCAILDCVDLYLGKGTACTFVEPYPELLLGLLTEEDRTRVRVVSCRAQELEPGWFSELEAGDLLFIDTSHVSKVDSDVNHLVFEVLPALASGVFIHFHDIYYPFEYPREWVYQGRAWNEAYLLRAFLQYNPKFKIRLWNNYVTLLEEAKADAGELLMSHSGSSLWLEKTGE